MISIHFDEIASVGDDTAHFAVADGEDEMIRDEDETTEAEDYPDAWEMKQYDEKELKNFTQFCDDGERVGNGDEEEIGNTRYLFAMQY